MPDLFVTTFYRFRRIADPEGVRDLVVRSCAGRDVKGIVLVAAEGLNGTISGPATDLDAVVRALRELPGMASLTGRTTPVDRHPFRRLRVRRKREIVTMGVPGIDPAETTGIRVPPEEWNALLDDPDVITIDTRNRFEVSVGTFENAIDPGIGSFGELPAWLEGRFDRTRADGRPPRIAMFCTGGIRCEKSTAFLRRAGIEEVYQLDGGILAYLQQVPPAESRWRGECFVFDERVSVGHDLKPGTHSICHACGLPVTPEDRDDPRHLDGVSCVQCHDRLSPSRRERLVARAERRRTAAAADD